MIRLYRCLLVLMPLALGACDNRMYTRDGVTDGDAFFVPPAALTDSSPDLQSWLAYSLGRSTCQLEIGGPNPARNSSFECEVSARRILVERWRDYRHVVEGEAGYLDELLWVRDAGFLDEYVWQYLRRPGWRRPQQLDMRGFSAWRQKNLRGHKARTRLIGSWYYRSRS